MVGDGAPVPEPRLGPSPPNATRIVDQPYETGQPEPSVGPFSHRIAGKIAGLAGAIALFGVVGTAVVTGFHWVFLLIPLLVASGVYWATIRVVGIRLDLARSILKEIRKHRFENLEAAHLPRGDELNDLIWQVYRTGQVLEGEMREMKKIEDYRKEFLGNVSHELKTPIFAIRGFTETLLGGALSDPSVNRSFLDKILRNSDRLSNLARDLSEISKIETGELKMDMAPFRLRSLVAEVLDSLEPIARVKGISITHGLAADLPHVLGDVEHLRQVITNLVDNAVKYNNPGGTVEVMARALPAGVLKVSVVDNGIGIPIEHIPRITERFYRVDKSRSRSQGGTGLGLAIVKHILAAHGTSLMVESRPGGGSTFGFTLPIARQHDQT